MLQRSDPKWDEFHEPGIVDWKRVRASIEHENELVNHRISWLFTSQAFLFGAFALIFQAGIANDVLYTHPVEVSADAGKSTPEQKGLSAARKREYVRPIQAVLAVIPIVGFSICTFILVSVDAAHKQVLLLERWWIRHYLSEHKRRDLFDVGKLTDHPPINGMFDARIYKCLSTKWLPIPLIIGWVALASAVVIEYVLMVDRAWFWVAGITAAIMLGLLRLYIALGQDAYRSEEQPAA